MWSFDRAMWHGCYRQDLMPKFRCSRCENGRLVSNLKTIQVKETEFSKIESRNQDYAPDWDVQRFSLEMKCDEVTCGEISFVIGETEAEQYYDEEFHTDVWMTNLQPRGFYPAPPIIHIPVEVPDDIRREVNKAFDLFWTDLNAAANRLRVSVERIMDERKVPLEALTKKGKMQGLDLNGRIQEFSKTEKDHGDTLTALRMVGNLGSHGGDVQREALLDVFAVYEDCLAEMYGKRTEKIKELKTKLISTKGAY